MLRRGALKATCKAGADTGRRAMAREPLLGAELGDGPVNWAEGPEIPDLERDRLALDVTGEGEEGEIVRCSAGSAAIERQRTVFHVLLIEGCDGGVGSRSGRRLYFLRSSTAMAGLASISRAVLMNSSTRMSTSAAFVSR